MLYFKSGFVKSFLLSLLPIFHWNCVNNVYFPFHILKKVIWSHKILYFMWFLYSYFVYFPLSTLFVTTCLAVSLILIISKYPRQYFRVQVIVGQTLSFKQNFSRKTTISLFGQQVSWMSRVTALLWNKFKEDILPSVT